MTLAHPKIRQKIMAWQSELRAMTGNNDIHIYAAPESPKRSLTEVSQAIEKATGIDMCLILKRTRRRDIVFARQLFCYCLRRMCKRSYPAIAEMVGYDNHSSAIHSENEVVDRLSNGDSETLAALKAVEKCFENKA